MNISLPSAVEPFEFDGRHFHVKRDDLIHPYLSGNKYRKLYALAHSPAGRYHTVRSFGGTQSNAMLSIAALCHAKGWRFEYLAKHLSSVLKNNPSGNLKIALELGMQLVEVAPSEYSDAVSRWQTESSDPGTLLLRQGGADPMAREGIVKLAEEISSWQEEKGFPSITVVTPSGTGTTAFYLAEAMPENSIYTSAVVGDESYLQEQMRQLGAMPDNLRVFKRGKKHPFAKPREELLTMYEALIKCGIEFDLIYGASTWLDLVQSHREIEEPILYVHSGGVIGNVTMLERYAYRGMYSGLSSGR